LPTIRSWVQFPSPAPKTQVIINLFSNFFFLMADNWQTTFLVLLVYY